MEKCVVECVILLLRVLSICLPWKVFSCDFDFMELLLHFDGLLFFFSLVDVWFSFFHFISSAFFPIYDVVTRSEKCGVNIFVFLVVYFGFSLMNFIRHTRKLIRFLTRTNRNQVKEGKNRWNLFPISFPTI